MPDPKKKAYKEAIAKFREKHFKELETSLQVLIKIRDDKLAEDKDRIKACQEIGRYLAAREVDKTPPKKPSEISDTKLKATEAELKEIDDALNA